MTHLEETLQKNLNILRNIVPLAFTNVKTAKLRKFITERNVERAKQRRFIEASNVKLQEQIASPENVEHSLSFESVQPEEPQPPMVEPEEPEVNPEPIDQPDVIPDPFEIEQPPVTQPEITQTKISTQQLLSIVGALAIL